MTRKDVEEKIARRPVDGKCPKCSGELETRGNCFHWKGLFFSGLVCGSCNALWDNHKDSFLEHVIRDGKKVGV